MNKFLIYSLVSVLPLTTTLYQTNLTLKTNQNLQGYWLEEKTRQSKTRSSNVLKTQPINEVKTFENVYNNKQIAINLTKDFNNQTIAEIYAKKPQKKYYLALEKDYLYDNYKIANFVKNKFYKDKTTERFVSADKYYALFDTTKEGQGKIFNNAEVNVKSSWGVSNTSQTDGEFMFSLQEKTLKNHIILTEKSLFGTLDYKNIEILTIQPVKFGVLPLVQVLAPPFGNAWWTTSNIRFSNNDFVQDFRDDWMDLTLPEGANAGQEWQNWFKSFGSNIIGIATFLAGTFASAGALASGVTGIVASMLYEAVLSISSSNETLLPKKTLDEIKQIEKIYNKIMEKSLLLENAPKINWKSLEYNHFSTYIKGVLSGKAWSTAWLGQWSKMSLHTVWGALNANINYLFYSQK